MTDQAELRDKYRRISAKLIERYGKPEWKPRYAPVDELVDCILSQTTTDANRDRAFAALKARFPDWESVRDAPTQSVVEAIRPAGLANQKAPRIQNALRHITRECGSITLDFLAQMDTDAAKAWLTAIDGIGPKTAAIVLCFAFGKPAFPVDTHVHRVSQRLGLIGEKVSAEAAHAELEALIPPEEYYSAHLNLIAHGRTLCQARKPLCERCSLTNECRYFQHNRRAPQQASAEETAAHE
ncbi:MAG: endonuclease III [Aggregatilineales bacterium]